jgi:hypothetical protein
MDPEQEFLQGLIGAWVLDGHMNLAQPDGSVKVVPLNQSVEARWILGDKFVEMRFRQTDGGEKPYEALYLLGFDSLSGKHVFHLYDSFGVSSNYQFGLGFRREDFVKYRFDYVTGVFFNELIREEDGGWSWHLSYEKDGELHIFAEKTMRRAE